MAEFSSPAIQKEFGAAKLSLRRNSSCPLVSEARPGLFRQKFASSVVAVVCILSFTFFAGRSVQAQQGGTTTYVYDEDGRLHAVLSPLGEAAVYDYDAAGNFTAIRRLTPNDLELLSFSPRQGSVGTQVTIFGTGFNQGVDSVSFNGAAATIVGSTLFSVVAVVPPNATTGPIAVTTPRGTVNTSTPFVVRGVRILPQAITLAAGETVQFEVSVSGTPTNQVLWSVNGIEGGNASFGTISTSGFYTAPAGGPLRPLPGPTSPNAEQYTVRATSVDDAELFGEAVVTVVPFGDGYQFRSDGLSVRYGTPPNTPPSFISGAISVRYGTPLNTPPTYINGAVSVRYGTPPNNPPVYIAGAVSVRYGTPPNSPPTFVTGAVSASRGPVLTSLSPGSIARGTSVTLTIDGVALNGAAGVSFFRLANGSPASGITVSNIGVNGPGTTLAATITVAGNVTTGSYVVVVTTANGSTVRNDVATNVVQIN